MTRVLFAAVLLFGPASVLAQPAPAPAPQEGRETYTYRSEGRRDPFQSLIGTGDGPASEATRHIDGPAGLIVSEISVRGVMQSRGTLVAMIQGPDKKTYLVHAGDRLSDGVVKNVTLQGLVIMQDVSDPLTLTKQREVRKLLRSLEDAKE